MKVFLHTSRGQGPWKDGKHDITKNMSIAPTSLLRLPDGYDCIIAEVSLGGSGKADIAAITNLTEDYGIAKNTRKASDAKADILTDKINVILEDEIDIWKRYGDRDFRTYGGNVKTENRPGLGTPLYISFDYEGPRHVTLDSGYLSLQYMPAIDFAIRVCRSMDIPADAVINGLKTFKGVPGRGEISLRSGMWHINDRNPGISATSIRMTLGCLKEMGALNKAFVIVDPVSRKVCDKLDAEEISKTAEEFGIGVHFTNGEDGAPKIPYGTDVLVTFVKEGYQ